jgi:hypothetical protein
VTEPHVLVVTSAGASPSAVVPVLAALEAAGMRVRAIDVGGAGGGGSGVADRVRRVILGEGAERRLRRELDTNPPDVAIAFDPHVAVALTVARDQAAQPAPVLGLVAELDPSAAWGQTDCDRFGAVDAEAAVTLADHGADGDRVLIVGPLGPRAFADAGADDRAAVRARFGFTDPRGTLVVVEVAGLGGEVTGQLSLQLSLAPGADSTTFLFDAAGDPDAAAVLRRQVPTLGLRAKLFGATADAPLLWRAGDAIVARPRAETVARAMLVGGRMAALVDDGSPALARHAAALELRKRAVTARSPLLVSTALEAALKLPVPVPAPDGADNVADIVWAIAGERRAIVEERRAAARAATAEKVRTATHAAAAAARATAMPGDLEDLGGGGATTVADASIPDAAEIDGLRAEVKGRLAELERSMMAARRAADEATATARAARDRGDGDAASEAERKADGERAHMHTLLGEMAGIEAELRDLDRAAADARKARPRAAAASAAASAASASRAAPDEAPPRAPSRSVDDLLADLKRQGAAGSPGGAPPSSSPRPSGSRTASAPRGRGAAADGTVDDELAALKRKMSERKGKP